MARLSTVQARKIPAVAEAMAKLPKAKRADNEKWNDLLAAQCRAAGLKVAREVADVVPGRKFRFDLRIRPGWTFACCNCDVCSRASILVEVQGSIWSRGKSGHTSGTGVSRDCVKSNLAQLEGYVVLSVTSDHIKSGEALGWIKRAVGAK